MYYQQMLHAKSNLEKKIQILDSKINSLPPGDLHCIKNGSYYKWFQSDGKNLTYIPKSQKPLAEQLAQKKYYQNLRAEAFHEYQSIEEYFKHFHKKSNLSKSRETLNPEYQELLSHSLRTFSQEIVDWLSEPFESNPHFSEQKIYPTNAGIYVRSKSEVLITMALYSIQIPFRYECALSLGRNTIYPDFTILHPKTGKIFYWEHFGKMDDPNYRYKTSKKLETYIANEIIPSHQLITTYETNDHPLTLPIIEEKISTFFL